MIQDLPQLSVVGVYAPEEGWKEETDEFYETLDQQIYKWNRTDYLIVTGDFNALVGNKAVSGTVGVFGEQHRNSNGDSLTRCATSNDMRITNTFF